MITEAANEAVRALVRDRRPSAVVAPAEDNVLVQQPDDAEARRARTSRRRSACTGGSLCSAEAIVRAVEQGDCG